MLVEDEESVRKWVGQVLVQLGYSVVEATNGEEAFRLASAHGGPIHLLITDIVMPRMVGSELAQRLLGARPALKVLYMSGYADTKIFPQEMRKEGAVFLQKPFTASALAAKIRGVLDG
jgi:DNA-binding NtrC family response regulator